MNVTWICLRWLDKKQKYFPKRWSVFPPHQREATPFFRPAESDSVRTESIQLGLSNEEKTAGFLVPGPLNVWMLVTSLLGLYSVWYFSLRVLSMVHLTVRKLVTRWFLRISSDTNGVILVLSQAVSNGFLISVILCQPSRHALTISNHWKNKSVKPWFQRNSNANPSTKTSLTWPVSRFAMLMPAAYALKIPRRRLGGRGQKQCLIHPTWKRTVCKSLHLKNVGWESTFLLENLEGELSVSGRVMIELATGHHVAPFSCIKLNIPRSSKRIKVFVPLRENNDLYRCAMLFLCLRAKRPTKKGTRFSRYTLPQTQRVGSWPSSFV